MKTVSFLVLCLLGLLSAPCTVIAQDSEPILSNNKTHALRMHEAGIRAHYYRPDFPPLSRQYVFQANFLRTYEFDAYYLRGIGSKLFVRGVAGMNVFGYVGDRYRNMFKLPDNYDVEHSGVSKTGYLRIGGGFRLLPAKAITLLVGCEARANMVFPFTIKTSSTLYDTGGNPIEYSYVRSRYSGGWALGAYAFLRLGVQLNRRWSVGTEFAIGAQMERGLRQNEGDYISSNNGVIFLQSENRLNSQYAVFEMLPRLNLGYTFHTTPRSGR